MTLVRPRATLWLASTVFGGFVLVKLFASYVLSSDQAFAGTGDGTRQAVLAGAYLVGMLVAAVMAMRWNNSSRSTTRALPAVAGLVITVVGCASAAYVFDIAKDPYTNQTALVAAGLASVLVAIAGTLLISKRMPRKSAD